MGRLLKQLMEYTAMKNYPMHMPGHKRNTILLPDYSIDITEIDGFDNLHQPEGVLRECMDSAASLYKSKNSYFLVNGSSCGLQASIYATTNYADKIIVARNCHKSVYSMLVVRGLEPVYVHMKGTDEDVSEIETAILENPSVAVALITTPFYDGRVCNVRAISELCHRSNITLVVDEAHGAHLPFADATGYFPQSSMYRGADIVVQSLHKTLPAMTQTAILHCMSERVDEEKIKEGLATFQSSSPSYVLMASIDECISYVSKNKKELFENYASNLKNFYRKAELNFPELLVEERLLEGMVGFNESDNGESFGRPTFDPGKILLCGKNLSMTGKEIYDILLHYGIVPEMWAGDYCLCMTSICDNEEAFLKLSDVLTKIALSKRESCDAKDIQKNDDNVVYPDCRTELFCIPAAAGKYSRKYVTLEEAFNMLTSWSRSYEQPDMICGGMVSVYPPGAPVLVPGEYVSAESIEYIIKAIEAGNQVNGLVDGRLSLLDV